MQRLIGAPGQLAVDGDQVARPGGLARDDDLILAQTTLDRERGRLDRRDNHVLVDDLLGGPAEIAVGVLLHLGGHQLLVERAAVDADAHRFVAINRHLADGRELLVAARAGPNVARVDAVLVERARAVGENLVNSRWPL